MIWPDFLWIFELVRNQAKHSQRIINSHYMNTMVKTLGNFRQKGFPHMMPMTKDRL